MNIGEYGKNGYGGATAVPQVRLTDAAIKRFPNPKGSAKTYWDKASLVGLRVTPNGIKSFIILIGSGKRRVIGRYPILSLQEARREAQIIVATATLRHISLPLSEALSRYDEAHCQQNLRPNTAREHMRLLNRHFGHLAKKRVEDIRPYDITHVMDGLLRTPAEANAAFRIVRGFFNWAVRRRYLDRSPCEGMQLPAKLFTRDRVLSEDELKSIWDAADYYPFGTLVRLLLLTGQRRGEISALKWEYIGPESIILPPTTTKNAKLHEFPYGTLTRNILSKIPRFKHSLHVLPARNATIENDISYNGWSKGKNAFDKRCEIDPWTLHDLRRTFATTHAAIGTPIHITERLLNHSSGALTPIAQVYNRHQYHDEMSEAVDRYEQHLIALVAS